MRFRLVEEFDEPSKESLDEAYWYQLTANEHNYYAYVKDASDFEELILNTADWKRRTHDPIDTNILDRCKHDIDSSGGVMNTPVPYNNPVSPNMLVITKGNRDFRGQGSSHLSAVVKNALSQKNLLDGDLYIHHINGAEYDQNSSNLVAIPYTSSTLKDAKLAHIILHIAGPAITRGGGALRPITYFVDPSSGNIIKQIEIRIV